MPRTTPAEAASTLGRRLERLARLSDERGATTRTFLSPAMRRANSQVAAWMGASGLSVREDRAGNLIGRLAGPRRAKTLLMGSHLDTVRDAGRFDGVLGVLLPLAALDVLRGRGVKLPFAVEVLGFSEEEGVRFSSAYLGSKGYAGLLTKADLALRDGSGATVADALRTLGRRPATRTRSRKDILGYLEVHIEQGPVLEALGLPAGVVTGIAGQTRSRITFTGHAGHAGTTPMGMRRDALGGAAQFISAAESLARKTSGLVATVGRIAAYPGASNVIPGSAELSLDVRHPVDRTRDAAMRRLLRIGARVARDRGLGFSVKTLQDNAAVACSRRLSGRLRRSVRRTQGRSADLASGAGHDAVVLSRLTDIAMLFVRCRGGLSHHPDEFVQPRDLRAALDIVVDFLEGIPGGRGR